MSDETPPVKIEIARCANGYVINVIDANFSNVTKYVAGTIDDIINILNIYWSSLEEEDEEEFLEDIDDFFVDPLGKPQSIKFNEENDH